MQSEAQRALEASHDVNCEGFESSKVSVPGQSRRFAASSSALAVCQIFALTKQVIENAPPGSTIHSKRLVRRVNAVFLFVVHPTKPLDPSNPRTKPSKAQSGGGIRPAYWYVDLKHGGTVGRGQPPKTLLGRKRKADVVIECSELLLEVCRLLRGLV